MPQKFVHLPPISLKNHPALNEKWVQERIMEHPAILGLGDLLLRDAERTQPKAGRLDLLLQDEETRRRYEVEIQLGATDAAHIIRTIEYWDIERKRYPQYDHCAVLVAEDITSRFLNVVSLFNGVIPLIAIQMRAFQVEDAVTLVFTTVMDERPLGPVGEDESEAAAPADRPFWEKKASAATMRVADQILAMLKDIDPDLQLNYTRSYVGIERAGRPYNFVKIIPRRKSVVFHMHHSETGDIDEWIAESDLEDVGYDKRWGDYRVRLFPKDVENSRDLLLKLSQAAHASYATD